VLANHSSQRLSVVIDTSLPIHSLRQITPDGFQSLPMKGRKWNMELGPYEGAIVEWKQ